MEAQCDVVSSDKAEDGGTTADLVESEVLPGSWRSRRHKIAMSVKNDDLMAFAAPEDGGSDPIGGGMFAQGADMFVPLPTNRRYNVLVVGPTGGGKTTFCDSFFRRFFTDFEWTADFAAADASHTSTTEIVKRGSATRRQRGTSIKLEVWDTPGFGDTINNEDRFGPVLWRRKKNNNKKKRPTSV